MKKYRIGLNTMNMETTIWDDITDTDTFDTPVEADTADEAVEFAIDWFIENSAYTSAEREDNDCIIIDKKAKYLFTATEVTE